MPAIRRVSKQVAYAVTGVVIVITILSLFILPPLLDFIRRAPVQAPPPPVAVAVESVDSVVHSNSVDIVARVRNPNPRAGVPNFGITFILLNSAGEEIDRISRETYLLPGSLNYIPALGVPLSAELARVEVEAAGPTVFAEIPGGVDVPTFNSFLRERGVRTIGNVPVEEQKGVVTNTSTFGYRTVNITGVAFDVDGAVVGISTSFIGEHNFGEQREVTLQWPAPARPTARVIMLPSTNIYEKDNLLELRGNPGLLRDELRAQALQEERRRQESSESNSEVEVETETIDPENP